MTNDSVIEEAAKAAYERAFLKHAPEYVDDWDDLVADSSPSVESWREVARAALAVFEKANAPTDDERNRAWRVAFAHADYERDDPRAWFDAGFDAGAVAEEPEGEVEYRVFDADGDLWAGSNSLDEARHYLAQEPTGRIERAVWVPVEQEGAGS